MAVICVLQLLNVRSSLYIESEGLRNKVVNGQIHCSVRTSLVVSALIISYIFWSTPYDISLYVILSSDGMLFLFEILFAITSSMVVEGTLLMTFLQTDRVQSKQA